MSYSLEAHIGEVLDEYSMLFRLGSYAAEKQRRRVECENESRKKRALLQKKPQLEPYIGYLRQLRLRAHITQQDMASRLHTKQSVISRFESGWTIPSTSFLRRYVAILGVEIAIVVTERRLIDKSTLKNILKH